jgi:CheY-like chemotaxis protein
MLEVGYEDLHRAGASSKTKKKRDDRTSDADKPVKAEKLAPLLLIVDDSMHNREMYADFLRFCGYRVLEASNGHDGLRLCKEHEPDLVLMDLSMPQMTGWEATRELKRDRRTRNIKILVLTGHAFQATRELAYEAGCDSFLTKPCPPDVLEEEVQRLLEIEPAEKLPH